MNSNHPKQIENTLYEILHFRMWQNCNNELYLKKIYLLKKKGKEGE